MTDPTPSTGCRLVSLDPEEAARAVPFDARWLVQVRFPRTGWRLVQDRALSWREACALAAATQSVARAAFGDDFDAYFWCAPTHEPETGPALAWWAQ